jgi:predicted ABC-type ATPase
MPLAEEAEIYDNTDRKRILIAEKRKGIFFVRESERWARMEEVAQ